MVPHPFRPVVVTGPSSQPVRGKAVFAGLHPAGGFLFLRLLFFSFWFVLSTHESSMP